MGIGDIRYTVLQAVNETRRKLGLNEVQSLTADKLAVQMVDFVNDVCNDLSDFGNWQETIATANVTAVSGQRDYMVSTSANIKNIGDVFFTLRSGPLRHISLKEMRLRINTTSQGTPSQFTVFGTDANGNPVLRVDPRPAANEDGGLFSILYFSRPPRYSTSDAASVIPYPARVVVLGTLARAILNESGGAPSDRFTASYQEYLQSRKEALNRFNGDTGWEVNFSPSQRGR